MERVYSDMGKDKEKQRTNTEPVVKKEVKGLVDFKLVEAKKN
jgi:hypothetical protein